MSNDAVRDISRGILIGANLLLEFSRLYITMKPIFDSGGVDEVEFAEKWLKSKNEYNAVVDAWNARKTSGEVKGEPNVGS